MYIIFSDIIFIRKVINDKIIMADIFPKRVMMWHPARACSHAMARAMMNRKNCKVNVKILIYKVEQNIVICP